MATRFYPSRTTAAAVTVGVDGEWDETTPVGSFRFSMATTPFSEAYVSGTNPDGTPAAGRDVLIAQFVSDPIAAGPITGTFKAQFQVSQASVAGDSRAQIIVRLVSNDGATVRGTLVAADTGGTLTNEIAATTLTNRAFPRGAPVAVSTVVAQTNDRIVVEVGVREHAATNPGTNLRYGSSGSNGDLPEDETNTATNLNPWMEFSVDLFTPRGASVRGYILE